MTMAIVSARKCASNVIVSKGPDVCLTPVGGAVVPVAYSSIAFFDTAVRYSKSVRNNGKFDFQLNSRTANSTGNEPGTQFGLKVKGYMGHAHADVAAHFVYSEGWATVSHRDPAWINGVGLGVVEQRKPKGDVEIAATTKSFKHACKTLGLDPRAASAALHDAKSSAGLGGADNCTFDLNSGDILSPSGEWIGNLGG